MEGLVIVIVLWIIFGIITRLSHKRGRNTAPVPTRRIDAVEEQRRRRMAYEATQQQSHQRRNPDSAGDGYYDQKNAPVTERTPMRTISRHPGIPPIDSNAESKPVQDMAYPSLAGLKQLSTEYGRGTSSSNFSFGHNQLAKGIVMAEILGPCRAKDKRIKK